MIDELERLASLWKAGALTDDEFAEQKQRLFAAQAAVAPVLPEPVAIDPIPPVAETLDALVEDAVANAEDDLLFDDLNAMLEDLPATEAPEAAPVLDDVIADATPSSDALMDLDAMLDEAGFDSLPDETALPAEAVVAEAVLAEDEILFDDLDALLGEFADSPAPDAALQADEIQITDDVMQPAAPVEAEAPVDGALSFDDLNAMLDDELSAMAAPVEAPASVPDEALSLDDLNALLNTELSSTSVPDASPVVDEVDSVVDDVAPAVAAVPPTDTILPSEDDLLFDDLNAMLAEEFADPPLADPLPEAEPAAEPVASVAADDFSLDDLDAMLESVLPDEAQPAEAAASADSPAVAAPVPVASASTPEPEAAAKPARRKFGLPKISLPGLKGKLARSRLPLRIPLRSLPQPILLGIGGVALFGGAMGAGVALALATGGEPAAEEHAAAAEHATAEGHAKPEQHAAAEGHAEASAESPAPANAVQEHVAESTPPEPKPVAEMTEPVLSYGAGEVMRQCPSINTMTHSFGTTLASSQKVPVESLKLIAGSGHVRTGGRTQGSPGCFVRIDMKSGIRHCRVQGIVRYPDGEFGAHLGADHGPVRCEAAGPDRKKGPAKVVEA